MTNTTLTRPDDTDLLATADAHNAPDITNREALIHVLTFPLGLLVITLSGLGLDALLG